jgi:beta-lactamase class A
MKKVPIGQPKFPRYSIFAGAGLLILALMIFFSPIIFSAKIFSSEKINTEKLQALEATKRQNDLYAQLMSIIQARADKFPGEVGIYIKNLKTGDAVGLNDDKLFPSASLVKIPIMAAVYMANEENKLSLNDTIKLKRSFKVRDASKLYFARNGRSYGVRNLVERMIEESDNTATNMLVDALGFGYINQKFVELGLRETDLRRGVMDLKWRNCGIENYTTCKEMAYLLEKIYRRELVNGRASEDMLDILKKQKVKDRIPRLLPRGLDIAHKTGSLRDTISDVGIVFAPQGDFIICVITGDITSYKLAKRFISRVSKDIYNFYCMTSI